MNPLLSWDDFEEDLPVKNAVNQTAALKAAESLQNLDTSEAEIEFAKQQQSMQHTKALRDSGLIPEGGTSEQPLFTPGLQPLQLKASNQAMLERASKIVAAMDAQLLSGGRVGVDEKFLLNCKADLNQLVPFKYPAFWSLYLTSCECHWMPAELGMEKDLARFKAAADINQHKFLARFYVNYMFRIRDFSSEILLNIYRMITNPECRQYILRQAFENVAIIHAMNEFKDIYAPNTLTISGMNISQRQWNADKPAFAERSRLIKELTPKLSDFEATTTGLANTSDFLEQLLYMYGYTNWIMLIAPIYQLMKSNPEAAGLNKLCVSLLRDMQNQLSFITSFMRDVFEENPDVMIVDFIIRVSDNFLKMYKLEVILASTCPEHQEVTELVKYYMAKFLTDCGIDHTMSQQIVPNSAHWFVLLVDSLQPKVSHEAGLSGNGGSLGW